MQHSEISTYCSGFTFKCLKDITEKEYIQICNNISFKLNEYYNFKENNKIFIVPEPITEGGFLFIGGFNNKYKKANEECYKSMRYTLCNFHWPTIDNNTFSNWCSSDNILFPKNIKFDTCLKAFGESPAWTLEELNIFKQCLEDFNIKVTKMPIRSKLN